MPTWRTAISWTRCSLVSPLRESPLNCTKLLILITQLSGDATDPGLEARQHDQGRIKEPHRKRDEETAYGQDRFFVPVAAGTCEGCSCDDLERPGGAARSASTETCVWPPCKFRPISKLASGETCDPQVNFHWDLHRRSVLCVQRGLQQLATRSKAIVYIKHRNRRMGLRDLNA